jgi:hypothetical protein
MIVQQARNVRDWSRANGWFTKSANREIFLEPGDQACRLRELILSHEPLRVQRFLRVPKFLIFQ